MPAEVQDCSQAFPCPDEIRRRVDFWIAVFSAWSNTDAVLHDTNTPSRVFEVIYDGGSCQEPAVKSKRKKLKADLQALANNLRSGRGPQGENQRKLSLLFSPLTAEPVSETAENLRCQLGVKDQFEEALANFQRYSPMTSRIIKEAGMPKDLVYLPFVESSYRPDAYSKAGAAGMWQIMPGTARSLGMDLNATVDERLDPEAATRAAMQYFKKAKKSLTEKAKQTLPNISAAQINPFIVTSYNYGVNGMRRAIDEVGPYYYKVLNEYKSPAFQVAVKNFYASFLAARHLAINAEQYFGNIKGLKPIKQQTLILQNAVSIERIKEQFDLTEADLKPLNLGLTRFAWNNWRLIPAGYRLRLPFDNDKWERQIASLRALPPEPQSKNKTIYRVRRGDTACGIANAFAVKCRDLIDANSLGRKAIVQLGQRLVVPGRSTGKNSTAGVRKGEYTVKRGDTACTVASRLSVPCKELIRLNKLGRQGKILVGQKLRVPGTVQGNTTSAKVLAKATKYKVKSGDTLCQIAERFDVPCSQLRRDNRVSKKGNIRVGQVLKLPQSAAQSSTIASADNNSKQTPAKWLQKVDDIGNVRIKIAGDRASVKVLSNETVSHYSDWLGGRYTGQIRRKNNLKGSAVLPLNDRIFLPAVSAKQKYRFEARRSEYHQVLTEEFKDRFVVVDEKTIKVQQGQSLWAIANKNGVPLWLLLRFNPQLAGEVQVGMTINVPVIQRKG